MDIPEKSINEILENSPSQGTLYVLLNIMKEKGNYNTVIKEGLKALSRFPEDLTLRKIVAESYLACGRLLEAEAEFSKVIKRMKAVAGVYRSRTEIYVRQKREDLAVESLKQYLTFFPEDEEAAILLDELQATREASLVEALDQQIDIDILEAEERPDTDLTVSQEPEEPHEIVTVSFAETYFNQGKLIEAREIYEKLVEKDPEDSALKARLEEISAMMDQKDQTVIQAENAERKKKERIISLLDKWRVNIKGLAEEGISE